MRSRRWFFDPIISVGFPMPKIAFLPIFMLWLGVYDVSKITMIVFDAIFPVVTATIVGIRGRRAGADLVGAQHGRQRPRAAVADRLPAALPQIMTGLQVALPIALIVAIVDRDADGRLRARRRHDGGVALCRFARRVRRHRRDRGGRLCAGQGHGAAAAPAAAVAPGGAGAEHGVTTCKPRSSNGREEQ